MERRHTLTLTPLALCAAMASLASGCPASHGGDPDGGGTVGTDSGRGDTGPDPLPDAPSPLDSPSPTDAPGAVDAVLLVDTPPRTDAPGACSGLAPAACLDAFCVPVFDDACCRTCAPGGPCADCTNLEYHSCQAYADAPCLGGGTCGTAPIWACGPAAPNCATANVVDLDSCDVTGCVPAYPSAMGDPDITMATCVPILGESCTVACRRVSPPCPTGMTPEGDGFCYTDRCIPNFVCGR